MWPVLFIENTNRCNLLCPGCKRPRTGNIDMPMEVYEAALSKLVEDETRAASFFWRGEPTLDARLPKMVQMASDIGLQTYVSTNSSTRLLRNPDYVSELLGVLDKICYCVDGYDQDSISKYRIGSSWMAIIRSLETMADVKTKCHKEMRTLMFKFNEGHEREFIDIANRYGMNELFFGLPIINGKRKLSEEEVAFWLATNKKYRRYRKYLDEWVHRGRSVCNFIPIVAANGEIASCCYDWKIRHSLGNVLTDSIEQINAKFAQTKRLATKLELSMCRTDCFIPSFAVNVKVKLS